MCKKSRVSVSYIACSMYVLTTLLRCIRAWGALWAPRWGSSQADGHFQSWRVNQSTDPSTSKCTYSYFFLGFHMFPYISLDSLRSNFNTREINSRANYKFVGHNSEPCGNFWTILRHKLPIIHPDLPIPSNNLNSSVQSQFLNPIFFT